MDVDGWEEQIDVDDSDLPSLLHLSNPKPKSPKIREPPPSLLPCSHPPPPPPPPPPNPNPTPEGFRPIPGPAGALQEKRNSKKKNLRRITTTPPPLPSSGNGIVSQAESQMMDDCEQVDSDFNTTPWLQASRSLGGVSVRCSIGSIKRNRGSAHRVEEVLGMVSSCRPNGLGGLAVILKDPTGSIGAFVHHKVLIDSRFSNMDVEVGCVLILKQVAVFPIRSTVYLNITLNNVTEIIEKNSGRPPKSMMSTFGDRKSGKDSEAGARADSRTPRASGVDHSESPRVDGIHGTISADDIGPHVEATEHFSMEKTKKNGNLEGNPDDEIVQRLTRNWAPKDSPISTPQNLPGTMRVPVELVESGNPDDEIVQRLTRNWAPKDSPNSTPQNLPGTMRVPLELVESGHTLNKSRKPPNASSSKADFTLGDQLCTSASTIHAMPYKQAPNKRRLSADSICANASQISVDLLGNLKSNPHSTSSEQNHDKSKANTNSGRANISRLPGDGCNTLASNLHHTNALTLGLLATRQELAKASNSNDAGHCPANLKDSTSTLKEDVPPVVRATEPSRLVPKALATDWTDEQIAELFPDCQDDDDLFKLGF